MPTIVVLQSNAAKTGGRSREDVILDIVQDMLNRLPAPFDIELAQYRYPVQYMESMNSVLHQEMTRYNNLTEVNNYDTLTQNIFMNKGAQMISKTSSMHQVKW